MQPLGRHGVHEVVLAALAALVPFLHGLHEHAGLEPQVALQLLEGVAPLQHVGLDGVLDAVVPVAVVLGHLVDLLEVRRDELAAVLLREARQMVLVVGVEDDVGAVPRRGHLDGGQIAQRVDGVRAVLSHAAVHVAQAVAAAVDGEPRLARQLRHAVVEEARPLAALGLPVHAAVEARRAVEARHVGVHAEPHAEALARLARREVAACAAHGRRGYVALQERLVVAEAAGREDDGALGVDVLLLAVALADHHAHDAVVAVLHERLGRTLEEVLHAVALTEREHGVGGVLHLEHVVVERRVLRCHVNRHLAQAPAHAAVGHPVDAVAALFRDAVDEQRVAGVVVLVDGPVGQLARVEGIAGEREALGLLQLRATEDGAHAGLLGVAAVQAQSLHADGPRALLGRARRRVEPAAARAHHADVAFVVPGRGHRARRDGARVVGREGRTVVLAVRAVRPGGVRGGARRHGDPLAPVGRPIADDALLHRVGGARHRRRGRRAAHDHGGLRQEIASGQRRMAAPVIACLLCHRDPSCSCCAPAASACESASSTACLTPAVVMVAPLTASMSEPCAASIMAANFPSRMAS